MANKKDLTKVVAEATNKTQKDSKVIVESIMKVISGALAKGEEVKIVNFGKFSVRERAERKGINPQTLEKMTIPAKNVIKFKPGKGLADVVNE
ncbi:MAG: DNA-binding protein [Candidatus Lokiarchaeota archaeon]|nr:DNA-binding protein [Candidatus Lokiarchaeota archaeon]